jgi:transcriptional regulator with XRE-family HTH domain
MLTSKQLEPSRELGLRLVEERKKLALTQTELANRLGISRNSVTQYEVGKHQPGTDVLLSMHSAGLDILYLLTGQRSHCESYSLDLDRFAFAIQEVRRQLGLPADDINQGEILGKAMIVYSALGQFLKKEPSKFALP